MNDDDDLICFLRDKELNGVLSILCHNLDDLLIVEQILTEHPDIKERNLLTYNPEEPHNSESEVILKFMESLKKCDTQSKRTGIIRYINQACRGIKATTLTMDKAAYLWFFII